MLGCTKLMKTKNCGDKMSEFENENGDAADSHMRVPEHSRNVEINGRRRL